MALTEQDYERAAQDLGVDVAAIKAVAEVESRGSGFLEDGRPVILFERHVFWRLTGGKWGVSNISNRKPGGYGRAGRMQHDRLEKAAHLDRYSALQSASWGAFQVMGFHWKALGYESLQDFVNAMYRSEADHLDSFVRYIKMAGLEDELRRHDWAAFARGYNGPAYAKNRYDKKMAAAYEKYRDD